MNSTETLRQLYYIAKRDNVKVKIWSKIIHALILFKCVLQKRAPHSGATQMTADILRTWRLKIHTFSVNSFYGLLKCHLQAYTVDERKRESKFS